jgi:hypothetical protein
LEVSGYAWITQQWIELSGSRNLRMGAAAAAS